VIVDTSAIMAILQKEPEAPAFGTALAEGPRVTISAATLVELCMVAESRAGAAAWAEVERLMADAAIEVAPVTAGQAALAREGWRRFGKGRHPAGLNLGDCFAYALARERGEPLLFKGEDFARTDVRRAL
jgi:ribonuclease VapC